MIYIRGHRDDYDGWAARGNDGWAYDDVLPLFKRSEDFDRGAGDYHGAGGPLSVITRYEPHPLTAAAVAAAQEAGIPFNDDHNGAELDGVGFAQLNIREGRRHSVADAFLRPVLEGPNLTVLTSAKAAAPALRRHAVRRRRVHERRQRPPGAGRARGRRLRGDDRVAEVAAALGHRDARQSSGASGSSLLVDLPGVGENLHDHLLSPVIFAAAPAGAADGAGTPAAARPPLHAQSRAASTGPTCSRSSSTCRSTGRVRKARRTASR